jgi:nucleotide-binding universal stress UspA family protein
MDFRKLLVATDGSDSAAIALVAAGALAAKLGAEVVVVTVVDSPGDDLVPAELQDLARAENVRLTGFDLSMQAAQQIVDKAALKLQALGAGKVTTRVETGDPATQLVELARRDKADLIVIGRRGLGRIGGLLLGSVSYKVLQTAHVPCLVVA